MKTYNNLFEKLYSKENLLACFEKAKKNKNKKDYVIKFEDSLEEEINKLSNELKTNTYKPRPLKQFIVKDPKTRTIHASIFRDRIVHHAIVGSLEPIFDKIFIYDSFASRKNKGTHKAILRFKEFQKKVSKNGRLIINPYNNNSIKGYVLKADIKHYFNTINKEILLDLIKKKIKDEQLINLIKLVLDNFNEGLPLGNYTSQFFANIYLNELDYFIKHELKAKYYIRYVDDFVILESDKNKLIEYKNKITEFVKTLKLELHPDKSKIYPLCNGITFLGYRIFYHYVLLRKRNIKSFDKKLKDYIDLYEGDLLTEKQLNNKLNGWFGYCKWANTFKYRNKILSKIV